MPELCSNRAMDGFPQPLPQTLQHARKARHLSQLELSLRIGVSQRHVSFVESGRARPSRELLTRWLQELDAPLGLRNAALLQAGFAPAYRATTLDDPDLAQANAALQQLLRAHEPMPALVLDAQWNLLQLNRGGQWLAATLMPPEALQPANGGPANLLDMLVHPMGLTRQLLNLREAGPAFLSQMRAEAALQPALAPKVEAFDALLRRTAERATAASRPPRPAGAGADAAVCNALRRTGVLPDVHDLRHAAGHHPGLAARGAHVCRRRSHARRASCAGPVDGPTALRHKPEQSMTRKPREPVPASDGALDAMAARLQAYRPRRLPGRQWVARCGVVLLMAEHGMAADAAPALLLMRRAERAGDPWSGHVSFPGGRVDPRDPSTRAAAAA